MKQLVRTILKRLKLERLQWYPGITPATFTCHHRHWLLGTLLRTYCAILKRLGLGRKACIEQATYDLKRPFKTIPAGTALTHYTPAKTPVVLIILTELDDVEIPPAIEAVARTQRAGTLLRPIFIVSNANFKPLREYEYMFEYIMPRAIWEHSEPENSHRHYQAGQLGEIVRSYAPDRIIRPESTDELDKWLTRAV